MPPRLRVVHLITKLALGGAQETVLGLCAGLDHDRFEVVVLCGPERDAEGDLVEQFRATGVAIETIPSLGRSVRAVGDTRALAAVTMAMREAAPDIVHTHTSKAGAIGRTAARIARVPSVVHTVHGWSFDHRGGRFARPMIEAERALARWCDRLVVVTSADEESGLRHRIGRPEQYRLIRSGIVPPAFAFSPVDRAAVRGRLMIGDDALVVGTVGRLSEQKDPFTLLTAFHELLTARPNAVLVVVGDGPLRAQVEASIAQLGIEERVLLVGAQHDSARWYAAMDVFALSSRWEGLPRAALEAVASGLPVVSTRCGGMEELACRGAATLCDAGDGPALATLLDRALDERTPSRAAPSWIDDFTASAMVRDTEALYHELIGTRVVMVR